MEIEEQCLLVTFNTSSACLVWPKDNDPDFHAHDPSSNPVMRIFLYIFLIFCFYYGASLIACACVFFYNLDFMLTPVVQQIAYNSWAQCFGCD